jgi:hypothetical protein
MAYSNFTLSELKKAFGVRTVESQSLFSDLAEHAPSELLSQTLKEGIPLAHAINTEKARSEMIVAPILMEVRRIVDHKISLFSGVDFSVDEEAGLNGQCDFLVSRSEEQLYVSSPVLTLVEAKNESIKGGIPQCLAEMIAARRFNEQEGSDIAVIYGCVTSGTNWKFLRLDDGVCYVDYDEYYVVSIGKLLAILLHTVRSDVEESGG